jgi:hypothetical protein
MHRLVDGLLRSGEPSVRWKARRWVLGEAADEPAMRRLQEEIRRSPRVAALLANRDAHGRMVTAQGVYAKWQGAHWVLSTLADLGYPPGDDSLVPMREQVLQTWLNQRYYHEFEATTKAQAYARRGVPVMRGRARRCASQQGTALRALTKLGLADERSRALVARLLHWQWPDGGWNCDKEPAASMSSVIETLPPMRGLAAHARATGDASAGQAARRAAEVLLERRLFRRRRDGAVIYHDFVRLHSPAYWHYDILGGLRGVAEVGQLDDPRCADALDLLESKRLPGGGWPAEARFYRASPRIALHHDYVDWGGASTRRTNEWVTVDALAVLAAAGRLDR